VGVIVVAACLFDISLQRSVLKRWDARRDWQST
jgi:hypothetical protein